MKTNSENINFKGLKIGQILGINVISSSASSVLTSVKDFVSCNVKFSIVTPNPELILMAQKDEKLKEALNAADLPVPDGVGLRLADPTLNIIKGRELFIELVDLAKKNGWRVFFLGGLDDEAKIAVQKLEISNRKLKIESSQGPKLDQNAEPVSEVDIRLQKDVIDKINKFSPQILFVAFGNPKQEIWIHKNLAKLNIVGAMAVGGSFRYIAGLSKLPPKWMAGRGLEWLWRLITEPKRIGRIFNAVIVFPLKLILHLFTNS
jgi:N-acetylglucosaminyldiphosphoundecaprenol N-acetyl-beta-D-mannosaminyltransferase